MRAVGGVQNAACVYDGKFTTFRLSGMKRFIPLLTAGRRDLRGYLCFPAALDAEHGLSMLAVWGGGKQRFGEQWHGVHG